MLWLTWRQHRGEAYIVAGVLALLAVVLIVLGREMMATYQQLGVGQCIANPNQNPNCPDILESFRQQFAFYAGAAQWLDLLPALLAMLVGAPLVARELEHGTHRLVWTQTITRMRWLAVKLALVLGACLLAYAVLTLLFMWWRGPFDMLDGRFQYGFDFEGAAPLAYVFFALCLAIAAGALLRKSIPAMAAAIAGFLAVRAPVELWLRPHYQPALTTTWVPSVTTNPPVSRADWQVYSSIVDSAGHQIGFQQVLGVCQPSSAGFTKGDLFQCMQAHGFLFYANYQPADRFWTFQGIETAIFAALATALLALTIWHVRRHIS